MSLQGITPGRISFAPDPPEAEFRILRWLRRRAWMARQWWDAPKLRELRLCETLALGEHRFLALVVCGRQRFLIGGAGNSVALLAELPPMVPPGSGNDGSEKAW